MVPLLVAIATIVFFSILLKSGAIFSPKGSGTTPTTLPTSSQQSDFWSKRIDEVGPQVTYQEFKKLVSQEKLALQHGFSHIMGELLYQKKGLNGFAVCDQEFNYSCYHGFFTAALADKGVSIVRELNKVCEDTYNPLPSPCQHGIGHGLMAYLGRDKLVEALGLCKLTNQTNPLHGCTSGLFMEYNASSHFSSTSGVIDRRSLNPENPHEPCNSIVPQEFRSSCYAEIPLWWREVYNRDFDLIGKLCQSIEVKSHQSACYQGVGLVIAPTTNYNVNEVKILCKKMPDLTSQSQCLAETYKVFKALPGHQDKANQICEDLPNLDKTLCENY